MQNELLTTTTMAVGLAPVLISQELDGYKISPAKPENGTDYQLDELRRLIGCDFVEIVYVPNTDLILVIDEEGKLNGSLINVGASYVAHAYKAISDDDLIHGNAILCNTNLVK